MKSKKSATKKRTSNISFSSTNHSKESTPGLNPEDVYNAVKTIKGKFMLSYNDSPLIRKLFKEYNIHTIETIYAPIALAKNRVITEVYITNY